MSHLKLSAGLLLSLTAVCAFAAPNPVGNWNGHLSLVPTKQVTPQQMQGISKYMAMAKKGHIKVSIKADHTFTSDVTGFTTQHKKGTWKLRGEAVVLTTPDGDQPLIISKDGKVLTLNLPKSPAVVGTVKFTRA